MLIKLQFLIDNSILSFRFLSLSLFISVNLILVSFSGQQNGSATGAFVSSRSEPISLATLDRDCFIIPIRSLERFLPAGVPVSFGDFDSRDN